MSSALVGVGLNTCMRFCEFAHTPTIKPVKPMNPQQAKLDSLKKQKEVASKNLKAERDRQKVVKAQQHIRMATTQKPVA